MSYAPETGNLVGTWTYRSLINAPDLSTNFDELEFGRGNIDILAAPMGVFRGRIYGTGWELQLNGAISHGNPNAVRFQGRGLVNGEQWIYDYLGFLSPPWPNGIDQRPALAGSIVRTAPHSNGSGGIAPAGVAATWYAVMGDPAS